MAERTVIPEAGAIKIPAEVPFDVAALIGCAVTTGVGAVLNTARVEAGASVVVIGCGGVGLSVVMGAALAGANPIVAVDVSEEKLGLALELGATQRRRLARRGRKAARTTSSRRSASSRRSSACPSSSAPAAPACSSA